MRHRAADQFECRFTHDEVKAMPSFRCLTGQQQKILLNYLFLSKNRLAAVIACSRCSKYESARVYSYNFFKSQRVLEFLAEVLPDQSRKFLLDSIEIALRRRKLTHAQVELLRLKAEIIGAIPAKENFCDVA
jgi:hypothetical protein